MPPPPAAFWDDLLEFVEDRRVIPIVGAELLRAPVAGAGDDVSLHAVLAGRLAARLGVPADDLPDDDAMNAVICRHLGRGGRREDVYPRLRSALKEAPLPIPRALRKLAAVRHFDLFVTTTFDSLLEQAINDERFDGSPGTRAVAYAPNDVQDLPAPLKALADRPTVYHLLGRVSAAPEYAVTEEDTLEFLCALQAGKRRPEVLFDELRANHLLLIGNQFPDWLTRFVLRLAKGSRLSGPRSASEIVAGRLARHDANLTLFLKNFSYHTQVYADGGAAAFVDELFDRYSRLHPAEPRRPAAGTGGPAAVTGGRGTGTGGRGDGAPADAPTPGAVFLSYASQDRASAERISRSLESVGIDVWFDRSQLGPGDDYDRMIRRGVKTCSLFVPVLSAATQSRLSGYFRSEWNLAARRADEFAHGVPFIVPVCIDDTPEQDAIAPDEFLRAQWGRLPDGHVTPEFAQRMVRLFREFRRRERGSS